MRIRSSFPYPPLQVATQGSQTVLPHGSGLSLLVVSLMLAFSGSSYAGGAAGGKTSIAASTIFGGAGAGYDASTGGTIPAGAGNNASGGGVGLNGAAGALTPASGGGGGGIGSNITSAGNLINPVTGGAGGLGPAGAGAGGGGDGVVLSSGGTASVAITGGAGGTASANAGGGGGGAGIVYTASGASLTITKAVTGGAGGQAVRYGGGGGSGVWVTSAGNVAVATGSVTGGTGGLGTATATASGGNDNGGGGAGVVFSAAGATLDVSGQVAGGNVNATTGGMGGIGGAGVNILSGGVKVTVESGGSIVGGTGGSQAGGTGLVSAGAGGTGSGGALGGVKSVGSAGGVGIVAASGGNTIVTSGAISGGMAGATQANAITFSGGNNVLELLPGYSFVGNVVGDGTTTLQLGGATGATGSLDASRIGTIAASLSNNGFTGFSSFQKIGGGLWTLTGTTTTQVTPWTISGGTLSVSSDGALGATSGDLTLDGGTLQNTATFTTARNVDLTANGGTLDTAGADLTLSGVVSGPGGLTKEGDGTLILSGLVIPNGITTITQGTVQVGDGGTTGRLLGDVATSTGTTLAFDHSAPSTFSGAMSGAGALSQIGSGTLVLTGANTYTGGTSITAGTVQVGDGGTTGSLLGDVATSTGTTLAFDHSDPYAFGGVISGAGALNQMGSGTLVLTGENTYSGGTSISGGTLSVSSDGALGATSGGLTLDGGTLQNTATFTTARNVTLTANGGTLETAGADLTLSGVVSEQGGLTKAGDGSLILTGENTYTGGTSITQGTVQVGNGGTTGNLLGDVATSTGTTLAFNHSGPYAFGGVISGNGALSQIGTGMLSLTGDSSAFTGASDVAAGILEVDGKLGGTLTVDSGATLSGIGTVGTTTLANGANLAPGNSATPVGTLNVNGNLTFAPGSTYQVQIPPGSTTSSLVNVSGTANLAGSVVHLGENGNYAGSSTYTILTANQLNGSFDSVSSNLAFLTPSLVYDAHDVMLRLQMKENFADAAVTHNQRAVAVALQSLPAGSDLYNRILNLPNGAPQSVFNALSGESHASTASVLQGVTDNVIKLPMDHLRSKLDAGDVASPEAEQPVWVQVFGNSRTLGGNSNSAKVEESDGGVFVGADRLIDNGWRVGGALGYTDSHSTVSDRSSKFAIDSYSATVYGGKAFDAGPGKINLTAGAAYTWSDIDSRRDVNAAGLDQTLKSTSGASTGQVFSELGYALPLNNHATIEPFVGAAFSDQRLRGFSESGGSTALDGESKTNDATTTTLGLHAKTALTALQLQGHLYGTVGLRHAFGDVTPETTMAFEGSQPFTVAGAPIARNAAVTEVGADVAVSKNTTVGVSYNGQFGAGYQQNAGNVNVNWRF